MSSPPPAAGLGDLSGFTKMPSNPTHLHLIDALDFGNRLNESAKKRHGLPSLYMSDALMMRQAFL